MMECKALHAVVLGKKLCSLSASLSRSAGELSEKPDEMPTGSLIMD